MKPHATKPVSFARKRLEQIQDDILRNPHHYTKEKLFAGHTKYGMCPITYIRDAAKALGMPALLLPEQWTAFGLLQYVNRVLEETV